MTLNRLYKQLGNLIEKGHGRRGVSIDKLSFTDCRESDGCTILPVMCVDVRWIINADDDGGSKENKDGSESGATTVILGGSCYESEQGS